MRFPSVQLLVQLKVKRKYIVILAIFLLLAASVCVGWAYQRRAPVLFVTDYTFSRVYGADRLSKSLLGFSVTHFRKVIPVLVDESAGPDVIAIVVEEALENPWRVIFPYRYIEGAKLYKEAREHIPVYVVGGTAQTGESPLTHVITDTEMDLRRAGLCAALFAGEKKALFFSDGTLPEESRAVFRESLRLQGHTDEPLFVNALSGYHSYTDIGCVVVAGPASRFFDLNTDIPVILFSWAAPGMTPRTVKVIFNDSPWDMAKKAIGSKGSAASAGAADLQVASTSLVIRNRIAERKDFKILKDHTKEKFPKN